MIQVHRFDLRDKLDEMIDIKIYNGNSACFEGGLDASVISKIDDLFFFPFDDLLNEGVGVKMDQRLSMDMELINAQKLK